MSLSSRVHEREDLPGFNSQLRYGDAAGILQDAYYGCESDPFRLSFINPSYNSPFKSYFQQPPLLQFGEMGTSHFRPHAKDEVLHKDDRLSRLPPEILYLIMRHMDLDDIEAFRMASRAAARLELTGGFWKDKLLSDMEWMQYPCSLSPNTRHAGIDWRQVYLDMGANTPAGPYYRSHIGFMNRRRVWELCQKIASSFEVQLKCHEENPKRSPVLLRAIHTPMLTLASPKRSTFRTDAIVFENDLSSLGQNPRSLSTFWSLEGFLTGFGISEKGEDPIDQIKKCGDVSQSDTHVIVRIEPGDWIVGFILYLAQTDEESQGRMIVGLHVLFPSGTTSLHGSKKGDRKLLRTAGSRLIVGVQIETLQDRQVSALSLLLVPGSEASEYAVKLGERQRSVIGFRANRRFWYHFSKLLF